ncbi:MAG TPA: S8 family serine peptidase [Gemmatimonadales bacterium]|nr:S8 family serine peptidase [Gemmatimonadales bacterium]
MQTRTVVLVLATACSHATAVQVPSPANTPGAVAPMPGAPAAPVASDAVAATQAPQPRPTSPAVPPPLALLAGLMPLRSTGVEQFRAAHPTYDGRGVLIAILDSGIDPGVAGLVVTSTGGPKTLDLRDFSGEGQVVLRPVSPSADGLLQVGGRTLRGASRIGRLAASAAWYAGVFRELPLGPLPASDVNGNGTNTDAFPLVVVRASDGWVVFFDSNLNGSFEDEQPLHDYRQGRETIALGRQPLTLAANFSDSSGVPTLDLYFDTLGHGTHVAGIAAGHWLFGVAGFDGVAPGAQVIGLKIANDARGGISVTGSMQRAMQYAARFAAERALPLVLNLSFGVGNEQEGHAAIDSVVNAFLLAHPNVVLTVSAGNDGPGLSTVGFPGSADLALSVGALEPGAFTRPPQAGPPPPDRMGWWSSRGGDLAKPDVVAPGEAFSSVPRWNLGDEIKSGTSMAAPQMAGFVACLLSAISQEGRSVTAADMIQALRTTAVPLPGWSAVEQGSGVPKLEAAYRWLVAGHQGSRYVVRTAGGSPAALRRNGFATAADTTDLFTVTHADGLRGAQFLLTSDAPWLTVPAVVTSQARSTAIRVSYRPTLLLAPGLYVATVTGRTPTDSLAGQRFRLVSAVIIPNDLSRSLVDTARVLGPGALRRYFLRVPGATSFSFTVSVADADDGVLALLYDPDGRPATASSDSIVQVGFGKAGSTTVLVPAEDVRPGVYELDLVNQSTTRTTVSVRAQQASVALTPRADGTVEVTNVGAGTANLSALASLAGAERRVDVRGNGAIPESLWVRVPEWAVRAEVLVEMPRPQWELFTDFGVSVYDSAGQQVNAAPMNYARGRQTFDIPAALAGRAALIELFPAFARPDSAPPWQASVRVRFFTDSLEAAAPVRPLDVVAGGRSVLPAVSVPVMALPDGFAPLIEWRLTPAGGDGVAALGYQQARQP